MKTFAIVDGTSVSNVIVALTDEDAQLVAPGCIDVTDKGVGIGWSYDLETNEFSAPITE